MAALGEPYPEIGFGAMVKKRAGWLCALFIGEMLTATAMARFEHEIAAAVVLALFIPLIISSGGNSGSQATRSSSARSPCAKSRSRTGGGSRCASCRPVPLSARSWRDRGAAGPVMAVGGLVRLRPALGLVATTVGGALLGVVTFGSLIGSMLPFLLKRLGFDPASASAPFVATLVDVTGIVIYFSVAALILHGTLL